MVVASGLLISNNGLTGYIVQATLSTPNIAATAGNQIVNLDIGSQVGQVAPTQFRIYQTELLFGSCSFSAAYTTVNPMCNAQSCIASTTISGLTTT